MSTPWTVAELHLAVQAYVQMLKYEKDNTPYVKAEVNRQTQALLPNRSHKSIEYRWQNVSAVLNNHKLPFIPGFKPANNVGSSVEERIWQLFQQSQIDACAD